MNGKVVVAMSGGVDSSVAALLLKEAGCDVTGLFMRSGVTETEAASGRQTCCSQADAADARRVAETIGARFYVLNFADEFARLIDYFVEEYGRGRTPNPCIVCNRDLKFGRLVDFADSVGADLVATGHYARVERREGQGVALLRGADTAKDQSYSLFPIPYDRLSRVTLPLGDRTKAEVRRIAHDRGLLVRDKEESQEICFVAGDYLDVIRERRPELLRPGPIIDETGREVGRHEGIAAFTIGQRRGVRIAFGAPRYVTRIDPATATVHVGPDCLLMASELAVENVNWLTASAPRGEIEAHVQIRYRHEAAPATLAIAEDGRAVRVRFGAPQRAVTPGQAAVFYRGDRVLGGGWIREAIHDAGDDG